MQISSALATVVVSSLVAAVWVFTVRSAFRAVPFALGAAVPAAVGTVTGLVVVSALNFWLPLPGAPLALSTLAALTILTSWNDFLWPLIAVTSPDQMTVPLGLSYFQGAHYTNWPLLMAANVMSLLPMLLVFIGAQRYFVQSVASTGLKG